MLHPERPRESFKRTQKTFCLERSTNIAIEEVHRHHDPAGRDLSKRVDAPAAWRRPQVQHTLVPPKDGAVLALVEVSELHAEAASEAGWSGMGGQAGGIGVNRWSRVGGWQIFRQAEKLTNL